MKNDEKTVLASTVYDALKRIMDLKSTGRAPEHRWPGSRPEPDTRARRWVRLAAERLVTFESFKGFRVYPPLISEQVVDLMHVRRLLEVDVAQLTARRIRAPTLAHGTAAQGERPLRYWLLGHGYRQFNQLDQKFHELLIAVVGTTSSCSPCTVHSTSTWNWSTSPGCSSTRSRPAQHAAVVQVLLNTTPRPPRSSHLHN